MLKKITSSLLLVLGFSFFVSESFAQTQEGVALSEQGKQEICVQEIQTNYWLDKTQSAVYRRVCSTVRWFDRLFGTSKPFDENKFGGKVVFGLEHSQYDGADEKVRLRINTKLPNLSTKFNAFIGRVEERSHISDSKTRPDSVAQSGLHAREEDKEEWLIGLGYSDPKKTKKGFDYSVGAKLSSGLVPYVKTRYRYNFKMPTDHFFKTNQTIYWRNDDGYGFTSNYKYTHFLDFKNIFQWDFTAKYTEEERHWEWFMGPTLYHRLIKNQGISLRTYIKGQEDSVESIPEYGISLSYRRPLLREWFYLETGVEYRWIKEETGEPREGSLDFGVQFAMYYGN